MIDIQQIEDDEYEANADFDNRYEMYAGLVESPEVLRHEMKALAQEENAKWEAFIGPRQPIKFDDIPF